MKAVDLDFSGYDPSLVEILPAGFDELGRRANAGRRPTALGGYGWPNAEPVVFFVVCADEGHMTEDEAVHLAVCADEQTARDVTERIARAFSTAGAAEIRRPQ